MEGNRFEDIVRMLIYVQLFLTSVCVGSLPCMTKTNRLGRYTAIGGDGNITSVGVHSGSRVQVSVRCDAGAMAQQSVTSQCSNGTWIPPWPRCEKPCSVLRKRGQVRQFVNGDATRPITGYYTPTTLPDGTLLVARCRDPGKYRLIGDQRRTCEGGQWTGEEPECQPVQTKVIFHGASIEVASNGTVVVYVRRRSPRHFNVLCRLTSLSLRPPRLTTPLVNDGELPQWHRLYTHKIELSPLSTDFSGMYTCSGSSSSHSVHVLFKENNGSCLNSCCMSSEFSCNPEGCYCDSWCERNDNCCDDYEDVCPGLVNDVFISNTTYNMREVEILSVSSPNRPQNYNNLENILWHVKSFHGGFLISFGTLRLHSNRDYVRIFTGISDVFEESTQIFYLTYNLPVDLIYEYWTVHPNMWLQFSTDAFGTDRGFFIVIMSSIIFRDCDGYWFQCTNGQCIYRSAVCDGFSDCVDSSDEYCTRNGSCSDSCCVNSKYSCNPEGCYCDSMCVDNGNCCDDYSDVCPNPGNGTAQPSTQFTTPLLILNTTECEFPFGPEHGWLLDGSRHQPGDIFQSGTTVLFLFQCGYDYRSVESKEITCEKGQWSDDPPECTGGNVCRRNSCLNEGVCWNRRTTGSFFCRCLPGTSGNQCENADECKAPSAPVHGRLVYGSRQQTRDNFTSGTTVSFECEDDYSLVGSREITCEKGQWSDDPPVCRG